MMIEAKALIFLAIAAAVIPAMGEERKDFDGIIRMCENLGREAAFDAMLEACDVVDELCIPQESVEEFSSRSLLTDNLGPDFDIDLLRDSCWQGYRTNCVWMAAEAAYEPGFCLRPLYSAGPLAYEECPDFDSAVDIFLENLDLCETPPTHAHPILKELFETDQAKESPYSQRTIDFGGQNVLKSRFAQSAMGRQLSQFMNPLPARSGNKDDPCDCADDLSGGVKVDIKGCVAGLCYAKGGKACQAAAPSAKFPNAYFRLCKP